VLVDFFRGLHAAEHPVRQLVNERGLLYLGRIARSELHRCIAGAREADAFVDHCLDLALFEWQAGDPFHRRDHPGALGLPERVVLGRCVDERLGGRLRLEVNRNFCGLILPGACRGNPEGADKKEDHYKLLTHAILTSRRAFGLAFCRKFEV